jgi:transposase
MRSTNEKLRVHLSDEQRGELEAIVRQRQTPAAKRRRAQILLWADEPHGPGLADREIAKKVKLCERQVVRIRQQFVRKGTAPTLNRKRRATPAIPPKFDGKSEAKLVVLCCSTPPEGRQRWTLQLLADELCRLRVVASVCPETVRRCLKKTGLSLGGRNASAFRKEIGLGS